MRKHLILTIISGILLITAIVAFAMLPANNTNNGETEVVTPDTEIPDETSEEVVENGWRVIPEQPNKTQDYGYGFEDDYQLEFEGETYTVVDAVKTYNVIYTDKYPEIITNYSEPKDMKIFDILASDKEKYFKKHEEYKQESGFIEGYEAIDYDFSKYKVKEGLTGQADNDCVIKYEDDGNYMLFFIKNTAFETEEDFMQVSYDFIASYLKSIDLPKRTEIVSSMHPFTNLGILMSSLKADDFRPVFDGIMNGDVVIAWTDENNVHTVIETIEYSDYGVDDITALWIHQWVDFSELEA